MCPNKSLRAIIAGEDEDLNEEEVQALEMACEPIKGTPLELELDEAHFAQLDLPLFSVGGLSRPKTMKLCGKLGIHTMVIMVDSGASHNFVSTQLVEALGLMVEPTSPFFVRLGDGHRLKSSGVCRKMRLDLGTMEVTGEFYIFPLSGVDVILGVAWLETLGEVKVDWGKLTMKIQRPNGEVTLAGDPSLVKQQIASRSILKLRDTIFTALLWAVCADPMPASGISCSGARTKPAERATEYSF